MLDFNFSSSYFPLPKNRSHNPNNPFNKLLNVMLSESLNYQWLSLLSLCLSVTLLLLSGHHALLRFILYVDNNRI